MAFKISNDCIGCGSCVGECPVNVIKMENGIAVIDSDNCVDCAVCAVVCPVEAPKPE